MLTLTDTASAVVSNIVGQATGSETGGLRIDQEGSQLNLSIAEAPASEEVVVENAGARVFLANGAADVLDDKVLDARVEQDGSVRFAIGDQADAGSPIA